MKKVLLMIMLVVTAVCFLAACNDKPSDTQNQDFVGILFEDQTIDYDGEEHTIIATGVPEGASVVYTNAGPYKNAGEYEIGLKVTKDGYNDYTKTATLKINKINFSGITFSDVTVDYDGNEHSATASGVPTFATATYTNQGPFVDAGEYTTTLKVTAPNYNDFTATAKVKINKIDFENITFSGSSFEYDGNPHSIFITGTLPSTANVVYSSDVQGIKNSATNIGSYTITATITNKNHNTLVLTAVLKITTNAEERHIKYASDGSLYFQNALDNNYLYVYDTNSDTLKKVNSDNSVDFIDYDDGVMYVAKTALISAIKTVTNGESVSTNNIYTKSGVRYVQENGNYVYFVVNGLTQEKSGIYKADFSGEEPVITCLSVGKAQYLQLSDSTLYFADGNNGQKLSKINTTDVAQTRTLVVDEKINNLLLEDGVLYYTVNNLLGDYLERYTISNQARRKLTIDAGESLTIVGDKLYYVNVDKFTTSFIGSGIYAVNKNPLVNANVTGTMVIDGGTHGVCSLETDGTNLYYYDVNGYKLMQYKISTGASENLLDGFVKPEDPTPISTGSKLQEYDGNIYYLDIWDGKTLHCYNPVTKADYPLTTGKVADFNIIGDVLYVNMVSYLVNNDIYSVNLKTGGELVQISTYSAFEFVSDGTHLYYVEENAVSAKTAIHKCNLDGTEDTIIYDKGVTNLRLIGNSLYFIDGNNIYELNLDSLVVTAVEVDGKEIKTTVFDTDGTYLYYREMKNLNRRLSRCKIDGTDYAIIAEDDDPINIVYHNGTIYYYSDLTIGTGGLFKVSPTAVETEGTAVLLDSTGLYAKDFVVVENKIYFIDYESQLLGNCHLYVLEIGQSMPTLIK